MAQASALSLQHALENQRENAFVWLICAFAGGIAVYFGLAAEPPMTGVLSVFGAAGGVLAYLWPRREHHLIAFVSAQMIVFALAGFTVAQLRTQQVYTPMIVKDTGPVMVTGTVEEIDMVEGGVDRRFLLGDVIIEDKAPGDTPRKVRLRVRKGEDIHPGQRVTGLASLHPPSPPVAPGAFDFQRQAYFMGIGAVGFFYRTPEIIQGQAVHGFMAGIERLRLNIAARIAKDVAQPQGGMMATLMTGQRHATAEDDIKAMRESGLAHLLAISGMHVGMIAAALFFFSRLIMAAIPPLALRHPIKKYAAAIAFAGALFYTLIAGMTVPTQRALLMTGIVLFAIMLDRSPFSLRLVAFAAFVVLLCTPESLTGVSFQMSFAAVFGLIVFYEAVRPIWSAAYRRAGFLRRAFLYFLGVFCTSLIAGTLTGLFSLFHFQTYALYSLLANIIAVPVMGVIVMPSAVAAMALMPFGLADWPLQGMAWGVTWILSTARWVSGLEGAVIHITAFPFWVFSLCVLSGVFFLLWRGRARYYALVPLCIGLVFMPLGRAPDVLINEDASLVALKDADGRLIFSSGRGDSYAAETWLRYNGEEPDQKRRTWPKEGQVGALSCDGMACRYQRGGQKISILHSPRIIHEECLWADLVIAGFPIEDTPCAAIIIDRFSAWRHGAHSVYVEKNALVIKTMDVARGRRPWTQTAASN